MGVYTKTLKVIEETKQAEINAAEEEARRTAAVPLEVPDFRDVKVGTLVVRSEHWKKERGYKNDIQVGIIVDFTIFEDDLCVAVYWPRIHWEGELMSFANHPLNVALRDGTDLPTITMNENQQAKKK